MATDYEQKYKGALERAKKFKDKYGGDYAGYIFPELAASEDEKIRKKMIEHFKSKTKDTWCNMPVKSILAWLEKQKEQKKEKFPPYVTGFKGHPDPAGTSDLEEAAKEYASKTLCDPDDGPSTGLAKESFIAGAEWQKEQKPAEWQKEQKPAEWSEEDEKDMAHIIRILDDCYVYGTHDLSKTDHENLVNKLKSLRPSWKPSEEELAKKHLDGYCMGREDTLREMKDFVESHFNCENAKKGMPIVYNTQSGTSTLKAEG